MHRFSIFIATFAICSAAHADSVDWSGGYVGAFAGAAWVDSDVSANLGGEWNGIVLPLNAIEKASLTPLLNRDISSSGALGGLDVGYNWQSGNFVYGAEADISILDGDGSRTAYNTPGVPTPLPYRVDASSKIDWLATFRGRLGWAFDRSLLYVTAGLAIGEHKFSQDIIHLNSFFQYTETAAFNKTSVGWVLGAGLEHALSSNWSLKVQYLHVDLGSHSADSVGTCTIPIFPACESYTGTHKADLTLETVTAGINYRF